MARSVAVVAFPGVSPFHLHRLFKEVTGVTAKAYAAGELCRNPSWSRPRTPRRGRRTGAAPRSAARAILAAGARRGSGGPACRSRTP